MKPTSKKHLANKPPVGIFRWGYYMYPVFVFFLSIAAGAYNTHGSEFNDKLTANFLSWSTDGEMVLANGTESAWICVSSNCSAPVLRATGDLAKDFGRVTARQLSITNAPSSLGKNYILIGTIGEDRLIDDLVAAKKLDVSGVRGEWESYVLQVVKNPWPGVERALVIAGSDPRGTIYGVYRLSEMIGVSPWYWWADVPVCQHAHIALHGDRLVQGPPAVKYRGIFLNDEDWGLRPWAARTLEPETGNIGPKTYSKIFELLLRLHANFLWPAMHPGTAAFNAFATNRVIAHEYGIVMGSSHCEQMLRNNVGEWDEKVFGDYNFATNPDGVLKYWEQRVRENGSYENIFTLGMRGIHDGGMPGGGTEPEKAARLHTIIDDQRAMLARWVNTNLAVVPQIFCPYKEVLPLYRLAPEIPDDITLVWPDDNYGFIRQFSNARERARRGSAGVYYHVSYWGSPRDYLWLCSTPPALIAEEMTKAFDYGADRVWMLNAGDLKPAEWDTEFFLKLAWNPHRWNGTNTYDLLAEQVARDFGNSFAPEITSILAEYYRLNLQRKPEHMAFPATPLFTAAEAAVRLDAWSKLTQRVNGLEQQLPAETRAAYFEFVGYPVLAAALANERALSPTNADAAQKEIHRLTDRYNLELADGKWHYMMSDNPRGLLESQKIAASITQNIFPAYHYPITNEFFLQASASNFPGADFVAKDKHIIIQASHATRIVPGQDGNWVKITGLGYSGEAMTVFPSTMPVRPTPETIRSGSPSLEYRVWLRDAGDWVATVRSLPTFSVETGQPQRYAIAFDEASPQIVALPSGVTEQDKTWQQNVLRNAALTTSVHRIRSGGGLHTLKIWMVDPGIVLDAIAIEPETNTDLGYTWPEETRIYK